MRKFSTFIRHSLLLATAICVVQTSINAQVSAYNFSQVAGTYTPITGGTVIGTTTADDNNYTDGAAPTTTAITGTGFPIGFNFTFNGAIFDRFGLNTNGWISLGQSALTPSVNNTSSSNYTAISSTSILAPAQLGNRIAPFSRDLQGQAGSEMSFLTTGTAPNRVCIIQWSGFKRYGSAGTGDNLNFQIRLYETTNIVETVYGTMTVATAVSPAPQVGLRGTTNADFNNRNVVTGTHTWPTSIAGGTNAATVDISTTLFPASGQTYRWTPANCLAPAGLSIPVLTATYADFSWTTNTASGQLVVVPQGNAANTATPIAVFGTTTTWPALLPATNYSVFIRTICGVGDTSNWSIAVNFSTPCVAVNVPWTEGFEGVTVTGTGGPLPNCWARNVTDFQTGNGTQSSNRSARTGTKYLYTSWGTAAGTGDWALTPGFNLTAGQSYDFSFWYKNDGLTGWDTLRVGVGTSQATINIIGSRVYAFTNTNYVEYRVSYVPATTGVYYFGVNVWAITNPNNITFDDFNVDVSPNCPAPNAPILTTLTATVANFALSPSIANGQIVVVPQGNAANTGTPTAIAGSTATLNTLTASTNYSVFIRTICSVGDTSAWSAVTNFTTPCAASNVPWSESFEGVAVTNTGGPLPNCWLRNSTNIASANGTQSNNRSPRTGTKYIYATYGSGTGGDWTVTPGLNLTAGQSYDFSFWYKTDGSSGWDTIRVGVGTTQNTMNFIGTRIYAATNTGYVQYRVSYTPTVTGVYYFGVNVWSNFAPWYMTFDDFNVEASPTCPAPNAINVSAVTNTSANLNWTSNGQSNQFYYVFGASPLAPPTGTVGTPITGTTFNATGLVGNTSYSFYVRQYCAVGDTSAWTGPFTFISNCDPMTIGDTYANPFIVNSTNYSTTGNTNSACYTNTIGYASKDVWYRVVINPCTESITASLCNGTSFDTYMYIYAANGTTQLSTNDDGCGSQSVISNFPVTGGDTIYVVVEGWASNAGAYGLTINQTINTPANADVSYNAALYCSNAANPLPTNNGTTGGVYTVLNTGMAIDATTGQINIAGSQVGTYNVVYTVTGSTPTCISRDTNTITIATLESAAFAYTANAFCNTAANPTATITGTANGSFSASSPSLVLNATTGEINITASQLGTYNVTYTTNGACFGSLTNSVSIDAPQTATFNYGAAAYCQNVGSPMPNNLVTAGGTFSSTNGLVVNPNNGMLNLAASSAGTYMVTYTTPNACAISSAVSVTVNAADDANFTFGTNVFCQNLPSPQAVVTGMPYGTFSSNTGLPVDITYGIIDLSSTTTNVNHTIIYATNGACPNFSVQTIRVIPADTAAFAYQGVNYCLTALPTQETPTITGNTGGTFSAGTGISINPTTGVINFGATNSQVGTYTVRYVTNGPTTCRDTATATIVLANCSPIAVTELNANAAAYNLYPNPNDGGFFLHNGGEEKIANLQIIDALGRIVYSQNNVVLPTDGAIRIQTEQLPAATYFLRLSGENTVPTVLPVRIVQP